MIIRNIVVVIDLQCVVPQIIHNDLNNGSITNAPALCTAIIYSGKRYSIFVSCVPLSNRKNIINDRFTIHLLSYYIHRLQLTIRSRIYIYVYNIVILQLLQSNILIPPICYLNFFLIRNSINTFLRGRCIRSYRLCLSNV